MRNPTLFLAWALCGAVSVGAVSVTGQQPPKPGAAQIETPPEKKVFTQERLESGRIRRRFQQGRRLVFSYGRSVRIVLPPLGNIQVVGWNKRELAVEASCLVEGDTEALAQDLMNRVGFAISQDTMTLQILSAGPQIKLEKKDIDQMRKQKKIDPVRFPYRIDYVLRVPDFTDLEIVQNEGDIQLEGLNGTVSFSILRGKATLVGSGGTVIGRITEGEVEATLSGRGWRGNGTDIQVGIGNIVLNVPNPFSAYVSLTANQPLDVQYPIVRGEGEDLDAPIGMSLQTRLGAGGAQLKFSTTQGHIRMASR